MNCASSFFQSSGVTRALLVAPLFLVLPLYAFAETPAQDPILSDPAKVAVPDAEVSDDFFAFVLGLLSQDVAAAYGSGPLLRAFPDYDGMASTPIKKIAVVRRDRNGRDTPFPIIGDQIEALEHQVPRLAELSIVFDEPIVHPIPVDFLGYHPGAIETTSTITLVERAYPRRVVQDASNTDRILAPLFVLDICAGAVVVNFDELIDRLFFGALDDLDAKTILLFRYEASWYAMLTGTGHKDRIHTWTFNLSTTELMLRPPRPLRGIGERLISINVTTGS